MYCNKKGKLKEFQDIVKGVLTVDSVKVDLPELQGYSEDIAKKKAKAAFDIVKKPVIVDDTSLCFDCLNGLPGPYIKWFLDSVGHEGLVKMTKGFDNNSAYAQTIFAYCYDAEAEPILFKGVTKGKIVMPRGENNMGWDPVFEPEGFGKTYAEMDKEEKNKISQRFLAAEKLIEYFKNN